MNKKEENKKIRKYLIAILICLVVLLIVLVVYVCLYGSVNLKGNRGGKDKGVTLPLISDATYKSAIKSSNKKYIDFYDDEIQYNIAVPYVNLDSDSSYIDTMNTEFKAIFDEAETKYSECLNLSKSANETTEGKKSCNQSVSYFASEVGDIEIIYISQKYEDDLSAYDTVDKAYYFDKNTGDSISIEKLLAEFAITKEKADNKMLEQYKEFASSNSATYNKDELAKTKASIENEALYYVIVGDNNVSLVAKYDAYLTNFPDKKFRPIATIATKLIK